MKFDIIYDGKQEDSDVNNCFIVFDFPTWLEYKVGNDIFGPELKRYGCPDNICDNEDIPGIFYTYKDDYPQIGDIVNKLLEEGFEYCPGFLESSKYDMVRYDITHNVPHLVYVLPKESINYRYWYLISDIKEKDILKRIKNIKDIVVVKTTDGYRVIMTNDYSISQVIEAKFIIDYRNI